MNKVSDDEELTRDQELADTIGDRVPHASDGEIADIAELMGEIEGSNPGADARVYRTVKGKRNSEFLFNFAVGEKTYTDLMNELRDRYGGGDFRMDVRSMSGRKGWLARQTFSVVQAMKPATDKDAPIMEMLARMLEASESRTREMFARMEEREREARESRPEPVDPMRQMAQLAEIMRALQPATPPVKSESASILEAMALYDQIRERAREDVDGPRKPWWSDAVAGLAPLLANALPGALHPGAGAPTVAQNAAASRTSENSEVMGLSLLAHAPAGVIVDLARAQLPKFGAYAAGIVSQVDAGANPRVIAESILDAIPESVSEDSLLSFLRRADLMDMWCALIPAASAKRAQYAAVVSAMIDMLSEPDATPDNS